MRFPVKLNRTAGSRIIETILPSANDPRKLCTEEVDELAFTQAVSTFKFGAAFKTTQRLRFPLVLSELRNMKFETAPIILDVGASDGSTSLDVMEVVACEKYYLTDLNIYVHYAAGGDATYFYDEDGASILRVTDTLITYPDVVGAIFPSGYFAQKLFSHAPEFNSGLPKIRLINPRVSRIRDGRMVVEKYNVLDVWPFEKADLIIAANILNRSYFTDFELKAALVNLVKALRAGGRIAIIDNRPLERATIFQFFLGNGVRVERQINGGTEIESFTLKTLGRLSPG